MTPELKSRLQMSLAILLVLATVRVAYILHERNSAVSTRHVEDGSRALTADEYVVAKKFYAHDLASAKALAGKTVWVKQGYGNLVYPVQGGLADLTRGKASLGDKTVLDALDAAANAAEGKTDPGAILRDATADVEATLDRMRNSQAKIGRARIFGERSVGLDDPGMRAFKEVLRGLQE